MPELPEVEVVRRGLADHVVGRTIDTVTVHHPRPVRRQPGGAEEFIARARGRTVTDAVRRGKFCWLTLDDDEALLIHLGMSGQMLVADPSSPDLSSPGLSAPDLSTPDPVGHPRHLRAEFTFSDAGPDLWFVDQRMFGGVTVVDLVPTADGLPAGCGGPSPRGPGVVAGDRLVTAAAALVPVPVRHIARDPLDPAFDDVGFTRRLRSRHTGVKRALLDQTTISGVGNIYADEALWRSRLHYARSTHTLTRPVVATLLAAVRSVMLAALAEGGTSFDSLYVNVNGASGYFDRRLRAYGQEGRPCERCRTLIRREHFMNRSSFFCPRCQRAPKPSSRQAP